MLDGCQQQRQQNRVFLATHRVGKDKVSYCIDTPKQ